MASTWVVLAALFMRHFLLAPATGPALPGDRGLATAWIVAQPRSILLYLSRAVWPAPLILDYGPPTAVSATRTIGAAGVVAILAGGTLGGLVRGLPAALLGAWFFGPLMPSSSLVPIVPEWAAEKRMYMPLAAVILAVLVACQTTERCLFGPRPRAGLRRMGIAVCAVAVVALATASLMRNRDYRSKLAIWQDTVAKNPGNARAWTNLGAALADSGSHAEAVACYERAVAIDPEPLFRYTNLALVQIEAGRPEDAVDTCSKLIAAYPDDASVCTFLGIALIANGQPIAAVESLRRAVRLDPALALAHFNFGRALARSGRPAEAELEYRATLAVDPSHVEASNALGLQLGRRGELAAAITCFEVAVRAAPKHAEARANLGFALASSGRVAEAIPHYRAALAAKPGLTAALVNLADALAAVGDADEAIDLYRRGLQQRPDDLSIARSLSGLLVSAAAKGRADPTEAVAVAALACRLAGRDAESLARLAESYLAAGRLEDALAAAEEGSRAAESAGQDEVARQLRQLRERCRRPPKAPGGP